MNPSEEELTGGSRLPSERCTCIIARRWRAGSGGDNVGHGAQEAGAAGSDWCTRLCQAGSATATPPAASAGCASGSSSARKGEELARILVRRGRGGLLLAALVGLCWLYCGGKVH